MCSNLPVFLTAFLDEPKYWWFELMILLNKTLMCGGLVVLAPGSPLQVLFAILIMLFHLLIVMKLAPYVKDSEDWSSFFSTLGLCLLSLGAYSMMLDMEPQQRAIIDLVATVLPLVCISMVLCILIFVDGGVWKKIRGKKQRSEKVKQSRTQVQPVTAVDVVDTKKEEEMKSESSNLRYWGTEPTELNNTKVVPMSSSKKSLDLDLQTPKAVFAHFDKDDDQCLDKEEVRQAFQYLGCAMDDEKFEKTYSKCDKDKDGVINFKEFKKTL
jgi:hypothetical protein